MPLFGSEFVKNGQETYGNGHKSLPTLVQIMLLPLTHSGRPCRMATMMPIDAPTRALDKTKLLRAWRFILAMVDGPFLDSQCH